MAKRKEPRINKKLMVSFDEEGFDNLGLTKDLSKYGMGISATKKYPASQEIIVSIAVPGEVFNLKGEVIWCKESDKKDSNIPDSIGIKITEAPEEYLNYIEFLKHQKIKPGEPEL
ncbi:MAG: PilZ domain-containing protein [Candidatus Aminicenantes bacterium]|nr:MAG: PilZ domain-containing protein [Candidatus Aminicenantes bacterium]